MPRCLGWGRNARQSGHRLHLTNHATAARSSLSTPRATIFRSASGEGRCSALASSHGARIQTSRSSWVVRITGIAFGWIGSTIAFGSRSRQQWHDKFFVPSYLRCRKPTYGLPHTVKRRTAERLPFVFVAPWQSFKGIVFVQKLNYLAAVVATKNSMPKVCFGHLSIAYRTARVLRGGIATEGIARSSKLSVGVLQHGVK